ncbi:MAG: DNA repair protein RecO C-terminal domain-containing protein, partial [Candidatus Komeilibacteria bacterium]|nr:DNA repair protein RecO C-terminal domain-containing protein [Candidatus Komeilibacteria bacterium]
PGIAAAQEFDMLRDTLSLLESDLLDARGKVLAGRIFLWKLMALSGWRPNLDQCALCREAMDAAVFYEPLRGFLCSRHESSGTRLESGMLPFLCAVLDENDWLRIIAMAGTNGLQRQWLEVSQQYYQDIISQPLQSTKLFNYAIA